MRRPLTRTAAALVALLLLIAMFSTGSGLAAGPEPDEPTVAVALPGLLTATEGGSIARSGPRIVNLGPTGEGESRHVV